MKPRPTRVCAYATLTLLTIVSALTLGAQTVRAATYTVSSTDDIADGSPGDGVCETVAGSSICTLRAAIQEANAQAAAGSLESSLIVVPAGTYRLALPGRGDDANLTGDLDINTGLTLEGAGADTTIIQGAALDRVLDVAPAPVSAPADIEVKISGITVEDGLPEDTETGGGIRYASKLVLRAAIVRNNTAGSGGGIASTIADGTSSELTLIDSTVSTNQTLFAPGGSADGSGGGISARIGPLTITRSVIRENTAFDVGGGVHAGDTTVTDSWITGNSSTFGGGLDLTGCVAMASSLISGNTAPVGAGLSSSGVCDSTIVNTTFSGNTASLQGGAMIIIGGGGSLSITYSTVTENVREGAGVDASGGGIFKATGFETRPVYLQNTIVASNSPDNCAGPELISRGNNVDSDGSCNLTEATDLPAVAPLLGPLADNGGATQTHALLDGSPAIDAASTISGIETDQRGLSRPVDGNADGTAVSDIGAYELGGAPPDEPCKPKHEHKHKRKHRHRHKHWAH